MKFAARLNRSEQIDTRITGIYYQDKLSLSRETGVIIVVGPRRLAA
jgi:hypothetical protein